MGQKINPKATHSIVKYYRMNSGVDKGSFTNIWFSDFNYYSFLYQDFFMKKNQIRILMKYYKAKVRFLKGRRRRLKSLLRISNLSCLHLPYKKYLLCCLLRPANVGLQRKHASFIYKIQRTYPQLKVSQQYNTKRGTKRAYLNKDNKTILLNNYLTLFKNISGGRKFIK